MMIYDRPVSAKADDRKKVNKILPSHHNHLAEKLGHDMMVTNSSAKKRFPSTAPKEDFFKWK